MPASNPPFRKTGGRTDRPESLATSAPSVLRLAAIAWLLAAACAVQPARADKLPSTGAHGGGATAAADAAAAAMQVDVVDFEWRDAARDREVPARLYLPQAPAGQKVPLVIFSHGLGGSRFGYSHLGRHWAEQGFASLHLQHKGSDRGVWTSGLWQLVNNLQSAASDGNAIARAQDVSFGLTTLLADAHVGARVDAERIAVAGHSFGANTALLVAGATVAREVDGQWKDLSYRDDRIKAAVILSAPPFYGEGDMHAILRRVNIPTLHVTGSEDQIRVPGFGSGPEDRVRVFEAMPSGPNAPPKALAVFAGGTHSIFTDRTDRAGPELNQTVKAATRELTTLFLRASLKGAPYERISQWMDSRAAQLSKRVSSLGTATLR